MTCVATTIDASGYDILPIFSGKTTQPTSHQFIEADSIAIEKIATRENVTPVALKVFNRLILFGSIFFIAEFVLAFFAKSQINGFISLVSFVTLAGLFRVFYKAEKVIERKHNNETKGS
jgi:uncharacterized membrane-anchored protein